MPRSAVAGMIFIQAFLKPWHAFIGGYRQRQAR